MDDKFGGAICGDQMSLDKPIELMATMPVTHEVAKRAGYLLDRKNDSTSASGHSKACLGAYPS